MKFKFCFFTICGCRFSRKILEMKLSRLSFSGTMEFWGFFFVIFGSVSLFGFVFTTILSKLLPISDNPVIQAIQSDRYYCLLVPLTLPVLMVAVYFHWLSMKLFKHA